jgi:hypothetical protein
MEILLIFFSQNLFAFHFLAKRGSHFVFIVGNGQDFLAVGVYRFHM